MKIGVLGAGSIAGKMAATIARTPGAEAYAVASRSMEKAEDFAEKYGFPKACGGYEAMLSDPEVELVYIATPHSHHYDHMKLCIQHKKPFLCEKSFTLNAKQAREIQTMAREEGVFGCEALWTRFLPSRTIIKELMDSGIVGRVTSLSADLSYAVSGKERIFRPELGGGALLDLGVYCLNFAFMCFGHEVERVETAASLTSSGVDGMENTTLFFRDGSMAALSNSVYVRSDRHGALYGDKGYILVDNMNNPKVISVYDAKDQLLRRVDVPEQITGYEYELEACMKAVREGRLETEEMPLSETVFVMEMMDELRRRWGMTFPQER